MLDIKKSNTYFDNKFATKAELYARSWEGVVNTYADLPAASDNYNKVYRHPW